MLRFCKYHGLGNDFVVVDRLSRTGPTLFPESVRWLCDRHRGIGADGVLSLWPDPDGHGRMQLQNADGSESDMCGNGLRCLARFLFDSGHVTQDEAAVTLRAGGHLYRCERLAESQFRVAMGQPARCHEDLPAAVTSRGDVEIVIDGQHFDGVAMFLGNPHFVVFSEEGDPATLTTQYGRQLSESSAFRNRTNVSFCRQREGTLETVVYERGVGVTQACGSGACAVGAAAVRRGRATAGDDIAVRLPGGLLRICVDPAERITMEGEALWVFNGEVALPP